MKDQLWAPASRRRHRHLRDILGNDGSATIEFGLLAGLLLVPLTLFIVQYGLILNATQALAAAARVGAEYARDSATCQAGIQSPNINATCTAGIQNAMQNSMNFSPALRPATITLTCQCDDQSGATCGNSCASAGRPPPNRIFLRISVAQPFIPLIALRSTPTTLNGLADIRIQ